LLKEVARVCFTDQKNRIALKGWDTQFADDAQSEFLPNMGRRLRTAFFGKNIFYSGQALISRHIYCKLLMILI